MTKSVFNSDQLFGNHKQVKVPIFIKILCRLINLHSKGSNSILKSKQKILGYDFKVIDRIVLPGNVCCLIFEEKNETYVRRKALPLDNDNSSDYHSIIIFNWFNPQNLFDYCALGFQIFRHDGDIEKQHNLFNSHFYLLAEAFLKNERFDNYITNSIKDSSNCKNVTISGFSLGGCISHILSYLLVTKYQIKKNISCIALGAPKVATSEFIDWVNKYSNVNIMNILLCDQENVDPVIFNSDKLAFNPNLYILFNGNLINLSEQNICFIEDKKPIKKSFIMNYENQLWDKLHSILNYYEAMY